MSATTPSTRPIYLDCHATTPVDPRVWEVMSSYFREAFGNPASSSHAYGWEAQQAVQLARCQVASLIGAQPGEIVFTSGATESNNLALKGRADRLAPPGHFITSAIEHSAVLDPMERLERRGFTLTRLGVDRDGRLRLRELEAAIRPETRLISIMAANNEIGVLQDMEAIGAIARARGVPLHTDATQAVGKLDVDVNRWGVDLLSLSAHKMYGPKGVGALYVRTGVELDCQLDGGGHERGYRSGTLNVPGIVGLGHAARLAADERGAEAVRVAALRDRLLAALTALPNVCVNGSRQFRLPHNLHLTFADVDSATLMMSMLGLAVSSGSACNSSTGNASHVLIAIGLTPRQAQCSIRFGLGRFTTPAEIETAAAMVAEAVTQLRALGA